MLSLMMVKVYGSQQVDMVESTRTEWKSGIMKAPG